VCRISTVLEVQGGGGPRGWKREGGSAERRKLSRPIVCSLGVKTMGGVRRSQA